MPKSINVTFNKGIQYPPTLGTLILKETANGKLAYGQNVDSSNDEYGVGAITPGPFSTNLSNNSDLTGIPAISQFYGSSASVIGYLYFAQSVLGTEGVIRRVKDIGTGVPSVDTSGNMVVPSNRTVTDMCLRIDTPGSGSDPKIYVSAKDGSNCYLYKFTPNAAGFPTLSSAISTQSISLRPTILVTGSDNNIYWIGKNHVNSISTADAFTQDALVNLLPLNAYASAACDWNTQLVVAYSTDEPGDLIASRNAAGRSGIVLWDYISSNFSKRIDAPCRYISAVLVDTTGNLIIFGGVDEGKTSIYSFNGYGFNLIYSYIGDMPRSRHAIQFDGQGRLVWITLNGQVCRLDTKNGLFDHLHTLPVDVGTAGILAKGNGSAGIPADFIVAGGNQLNGVYYIKRMYFGSYSGDGGGADGVTTPLAVSGIYNLPHNSTITRITWHLTRPLASGEKVILQVYQNGSSTATTYSTLDYSVDGAVSGKRETLTLPDLNNFSLGVIWKMSDNSTAPAVSSAEVEYS